MIKKELPQQRIDYSKIITGKELDYANYEAKFRFWDKLVEEGYLTSEDLDKRAYAANCLNDLTIFCYHFLTLDGEPLKLTAYQDAIGFAVNEYDWDPMHPSRYILFKAANQIGKSQFLAALAIKDMFKKWDTTVLMISNTLPQSQALLRNIKHLLNNSKLGENWKESTGSVDNTTMLSFELRDKNTDRLYKRELICAPASDGVLGYPAKKIYWDELDFCDDAKSFFWSKLKPRTNKTKGQIIGFSNPNPHIPRVSSALWGMWNSTEIFQRRFEFNFLDAPWNSLEEFNKDKRNTPGFIFASTHEGKFPQDGGAFFKQREIDDMLVKDWDCDILPIVNEEVFIGVDLGKMNDQTVITIGTRRPPVNPDDKLCDINIKYIEEFQLKTDYEIIAERLHWIQEYYKDFGCTIGYDATGQKTFEEILRIKDVVAWPVDFAKKESNKTKLYNDFKLMAEQRKIKIAYHPKMAFQLSGLEFKATKNKQLNKVENKSDTIHDDFPDSVAIMIHVAQFPTYIEATLELF